MSRTNVEPLILIKATSTYLLPRLIGYSRANSLLLTGATVSPDSPYIKDLYHQILPTREAVYPAAKAFAEELAASTSQVSIAYTKGLLQHPGDSLEENHLLDSRAIKLLAASEDGAEGALSFKERRLPKFIGTLSKSSSPWFPWVIVATRFLLFSGTELLFYIVATIGHHPSQSKTLKNSSTLVFLRTAMA